jgi:hypothetical protein
VNAEILTSGLTVRDAMRRLDVSQPQVWRLIHAGRLVAEQTRWGYWLIAPASLAQYETERAARKMAKAAC